MKYLLTFLTCIFAVVGAKPMDKGKQVIILLGPPGSGKGTQAKKLSQQLNIPHISTGDLFRENLRKETPLGKKVKGYMDRGDLVPDSLVLDMLGNRISQEDSASGYLLDGFPRTIPQAEALDEQLGEDVRLVAINLEVSDDVIVKRISGRLSCPDCGFMFNSYFSPPKDEGICDQCGATLIQRQDDKEDVVVERLRVYHEKTAPLISFYKKKGVLVNFDGEQDPEKLFHSIFALFQ